MKRVAFFFLLAGAAIVCLIVLRLRQHPTDTAGKKRVLMLGDSIAIGYIREDSISTGYVPLVQKMISDEAVVRYPITSEGNPENCCGTKFGVENMDRWLQIEGGKWDVIHFNWGLHDLKHENSSGTPSELEADPPQSSVEVYEKQLGELVEKMQATGAKLIFSTSTPVPDAKLKPYRSDADVVRYNEAALRVMKEHQVAVVDLYAFIKPRAAELRLPVSVHYNPEGCKALAGEVTKAVKMALK